MPLPGKKTAAKKAATRRKPGELEKRLGYRFHNPALLDAALTHRSFRFETPGIEADNQRLEFLGDAALALAAAAWLYEKHPEFQEGDLTEARSRCIRTASLARVARNLNLGASLRLGRGESLVGGADRDTMLEDALEAVLGAIYLDGGWKALNDAFHRIFPPVLDTDDPGIRGPDNPKGALQELCQKRFKISPVYRLVETSGPAHRKEFAVEAWFGEKRLASGRGKSRREAEGEAARRALAEHLIEEIETVGSN